MELDAEDFAPAFEDGVCHSYWAAELVLSSPWPELHRADDWYAALVFVLAERSPA